MIPFEVRLRTARGREWRKFRDPVAVLRATRADDVVRCLGEVDRAVRRDGCYAAGFVTEAAAAFGLPAADPATGGLPPPNGRGHFNVAIRTIAIDREKREAEFGVGSGIVWDSVERDEYDECVLKASILLKRPPASYAAGPHPDFRLLETIGWTPAAGFALSQDDPARGL